VYERTQLDRRSPPTQAHLKCRRVLKGTTGHTGKIYSMAWCADSERVLSAAQDGKLMIWDARDGAKLGMANLKSNWVMTCAYSPSGTLVASGGLDNLCTIFEVEKMQTGEAVPVKELSGHAGFLSCCRFIDDKQLLTSSGDGTMMLWDIERGAKLGEFIGHGGDVTSIGLLRSKSAVATCSIDRTIKVWDLRDRRCVQTMSGHTGDINGLAVFPSEEAIGEWHCDITRTVCLPNTRERETRIVISSLSVFFFPFASTLAHTNKFIHVYICECISMFLHTGSHVPCRHGQRRLLGTAL
jgi:WD40 repeat protein